MTSLKVTQIKSAAGIVKDQVATLKALGLTKINSSKTHQDVPSVRGMINKVRHLVSVEEIVND